MDAYKIKKKKRFRRHHQLIHEVQTRSTKHIQLYQKDKKTASTTNVSTVSELKGRNGVTLIGNSKHTKHTSNHIDMHQELHKVQGTLQRQRQHHAPASFLSEELIFGQRTVDQPPRQYN